MAHKDVPMDSIMAGVTRTQCYILAVAALFVAAVYYTLRIGRRDPRMPPGPPTVPILGNAHLIPRTGLYKQ
jgi:hypothetical protein